MRRAGRSRLSDAWRYTRLHAIAVTWWLEVVAVVALFLLAFGRLFRSERGPADILLAMAVILLATAAILNARASGVLAERRQAETASFGRILQALARSVSPDAIVEAIIRELGATTAADHVAVVRLRPYTDVLDVTFVSTLPGAATSNTQIPAAMLTARHGVEPPRMARARADGPQAHRDREDWHEMDAPRILGTSEHVGRGPADEGRPAVGDEHWRPRAAAGSPRGPAPTAPEVAERIAAWLRDSYGLHNTLAVPLHSGDAVVGAIVLSRRTEAAWPGDVARLLESAAAETSAALERVYSHHAAELEARTDELTQLPNRRYFDEYCALVVSRRRAADRVGILAIDVDRFKNLNDTYGHQVGDQVLRAIADAIQGAVRDEDIPARYGGEEFVVLLRNPADGIALEVGERVRLAVHQLDLARLGVAGVTVSVGVAASDDPGEPIADVVGRADRALYAAKRAGRDRVVESRPALVW